MFEIEKVVGIEVMAETEAIMEIEYMVDSKQIAGAKAMVGIEECQTQNRWTGQKRGLIQKRWQRQKEQQKNRCCGFRGYGREKRDGRDTIHFLERRDDIDRRDGRVRQIRWHRQKR